MNRKKVKLKLVGSERSENPKSEILGRYTAYAIGDRVYVARGEREVFNGPIDEDGGHSRAYKMLENMVKLKVLAKSEADMIIGVLTLRKSFLDISKRYEKLGGNSTGNLGGLFPGLK